MHRMALQLVDLREVEELGPFSRFLLEDELGYCLSQRRPLEHVAARVAAKRAVFEALGAKHSQEPPWHEVEVLRDRSGRVDVLLRGSLQRLARSRGAAAVNLSMSHTHKLAVALVVLEETPEAY